MVDRLSSGAVSMGAAASGHPFLWVSSNALYAFYEYKSKATEKGEIGVAISTNKGMSWQHMGTALQESWHLSYPFVFLYQGEVYMLPEGYQSGSLRLYRAVEFPLKWQFDRVLYERPLVDASIVKYQGMFWMFASDQDKTAQLCGQLEIYYAPTPLGPWTPHAANPVLNGDPSCGARPGGRPLVYQRSLYRFAQDCNGAYGKALLAYKVDVLNTTHFVQTPIAHNLPVGWWNAGRVHHLDAHQLPDGRWVALMDGDRGPECPGEYEFVQATCECRPRIVAT